MTRIAVILELISPGSHYKYTMFIRIFSRIMRTRLPLSALFFSDSQMQHPLQIDKEPFNQFGQTYESCRSAPSSYNGQTTRCISTFDENKKLKQFDFYAVTASRYYAAVAVGIWCANWQLGCSALDIKGHFEIPADHKRDLLDEKTNKTIPRYDVSWLVDA